MATNEPAPLVQVRVTAEKKPPGGAPALAPAPADPRADPESLAARHLAHSATVATLATVTDSLRSSPLRGGGGSGGGVPHASSSAVSSYVLLADPAASSVSLRHVQEVAAKADVERVTRSPRSSVPRMPEYIAAEVADAVAKAAAEEAYRDRVAARLEATRKEAEKVLRAAQGSKAVQPQPTRRLSGTTIAIPPGGDAGRPEAAGPPVVEADPAAAARRRRASFVKESLSLLHGSVALLPAREFSLLPSHGDLLSQRIADLAAGPSLEPARRLSYQPVFEAPSLPHDPALQEELQHDASRRRRSLTLEAVPLDRPSEGVAEMASLGLSAVAREKRKPGAAKALLHPHPPLRAAPSTASFSPMLPRRASRGLLPRGLSMASLGTNGGVAESEGAVSLRHLLHPQATSMRVASLGLVTSETAAALEDRQARLRRSESWAAIEGANGKGYFRPPPVEIADPAPQPSGPAPAPAPAPAAGTGASPRPAAEAAVASPPVTQPADQSSAAPPAPSPQPQQASDGVPDTPAVSLPSPSPSHDGRSFWSGSGRRPAGPDPDSGATGTAGAANGASAAPARAPPAAASPRSTTRRFVFQPEEGSRAQVEQLFAEYDRAPPAALVDRGGALQPRRDSATPDGGAAGRRRGSPLPGDAVPAVGLRSTTLAPPALPAPITQLHLQHLELPAYLLAAASHAHSREAAAAAAAGTASGGELRMPFHTLAMTSLVVHAPMDPAIGQLLRKRRLRRYGVADYAPRERGGGAKEAAAAAAGGGSEPQSPRSLRGEGGQGGGGARSVSPRFGPLAARQQAAALLAASLPSALPDKGGPSRAAVGSSVKADPETRPAAAATSGRESDGAAGRRPPAYARRSIEDLTRALDAAIASTTPSVDRAAAPATSTTAAAIPSVPRQVRTEPQHPSSSMRPSGAGASGPSPAALALRKLEEGRLSARLEVAMDRDLAANMAAVRKHKKATGLAT